MKSSPSKNQSNPVFAETSGEGEPTEDGFRLLAKIIASAIRRTNEAQAILRQSSQFDAKTTLKQLPALI